MHPLVIYEYVCIHTLIQACSTYFIYYFYLDENNFVHHIVYVNCDIYSQEQTSLLDEIKQYTFLFLACIDLAVISFSYPFVDFMVSMGRKHLSHIFIVSLLSNPGSNFVFCNVLDLLQNPFIIYKYVKMTVREVGRIVPNTNELGIKEILIRYKYQEIFSRV